MQLKMDFENYINKHLDNDNDELDPNDPNQCELPDVYLCFVRLIGEENDGMYRYEFIFTDNPDECWGDGFDEKPSGIINDLHPFDEYVTEIHILKTNIKFDLIQNNCCFSMQDCMDGCVALAYYLDESWKMNNIIFMYGENIEDVEKKLSDNNLLLE